MIVILADPDGLLTSRRKFGVATVATEDDPIGDLDEAESWDVQVWVVRGAHADEAQARTEAAAGDDRVWVRSQMRPGGNELYLAEFAPEHDGALLIVDDERSDMADAIEHANDITCSGCGRVNNDGEGYDGECGNCADESYAADEDDGSDDYNEPLDEDDEEDE